MIDEIEPEEHRTVAAISEAAILRKTLEQVLRERDHFRRLLDETPTPEEIFEKTRKAAELVACPSTGQHHCRIFGCAGPGIRALKFEDVCP